MKYRIWIGLSIIALCTLIYSCEKHDVPPAPAVVILPAGCDTVNLTYSSGTNNMKSIIDLQCGTGNSSCHAPHGASGYDFSTYSGVQTQFSGGSSSPAYTSLFKGTPNAMPKTPQAGWSDSSTCYLAKFKAWINAGIPQ